MTDSNEPLPSKPDGKSHRDAFVVDDTARPLSQVGADGRQAEPHALAHGNKYHIDTTATPQSQAGRGR